MTIQTTTELRPFNECTEGEAHNHPDEHAADIRFLEEMWGWRSGALFIELHESRVLRRVFTRVWGEEPYVDQFEDFNHQYEYLVDQFERGRLNSRDDAHHRSMLISLESEVRPSDRTSVRPLTEAQQRPVTPS